MRASRVMTRNVTCIAPDVSLDRAWSLMGRLAVRHLPVVFAGRLVGVVSDRDLLRRGIVVEGGALAFPPLAVGEAMTPHPVSCQASVTVATVASLMLEHRIDSVPIVTARDELVGLVTSTDLLELLTAPERESAPLPFTFELETVDGRAVA
ncbi:MAG: CBS domain-containing protein [Myxococcaceae bacterium]|jgi:acetoin utilization protein AcuB|nr:CBS domain-containing protein [Myxococcaceae bacterium]MCA3014422.1 CBS domain-containing protein [Myxococcaceae bacterium]